MKKFLKNTLIFIPVCIVIYAVLLVIWGNLSPKFLKQNLNYTNPGYGHTYTRLKEADTLKNIDILFLGSSHTYRTFDNRIYDSKNLKTFNFGTSAQTPLQTKYLLNKYLEKLNPKLIIYEVYPGNFSSDGIESSLDLIANTDFNFDLTILALKQKNIKLLNSLIFSFYEDLIGKKSKVVETKIKADDEYVSGGFVRKKLKTFQHKEFPATKWNLNQKQLNIFDTILTNLKFKKYKTILVQAPINNTYYNAHKNNTYYDSLMNSKGEYFNFNKLIKLDDSLDFYDYHHLNQNGVEKFNRFLIDTLGL